jgi:hypothetical protein
MVAWCATSLYKKIRPYPTTYQEWGVSSTREMNSAIAYVSTKEKARVVCELLTKWEIK